MIVNINILLLQWNLRGELVSMIPSSSTRKRNYLCICYRLVCRRRVCLNVPWGAINMNIWEHRLVFILLCVLGSVETDSTLCGTLSSQSFYASHRFLWSTSILLSGGKVKNQHPTIHAELLTVHYTVVCSVKYSNLFMVLVHMYTPWFTHFLNFCHQLLRLNVMLSTYHHFIII